MNKGTLFDVLQKTKNIITGLECRIEENEEIDDNSFPSLYTQDKANIRQILAIDWLPSLQQDLSVFFVQGRDDDYLSALSELNEAIQTFM